MSRKTFYKDSGLMGWIIPTAAAVVLYWLTMCRTVYVGDSGEFSLAMKTLGISHPPGYPLFTIAGHVFVSLLGFLRPALAANLFGVFLAAAAIPALFFIMGGRRHPWMAGAITLLWIVSAAYWDETVGIEVYAFSLALIAAITALALSEYDRKWYIIAYLLGLALAHHPSALAVVPGLIYLFFSEDKRHRKPWPVYGLLFALGISLYLYLPVRASLSPLSDWGHPAALNLLWNHMTAAQYRGFAAFSLGDLWNGLKMFLSLLLGNWWWLGVGLAIWGLTSGWKTDRKLVIFALTLLAANLVLTAFYQIPDIDSYYLPGLLAVWILMGLGLLAIGERYKKLPLGLAPLVCAIALLMVADNYREADRSRITLAEDYGKLILDSAGSGTVFTYDDNASFSALYLRYAEGYKPGVEVYDQSVRAQALLMEASRLSGEPVSDYLTARNLYCRKSGRPIFLAKSHLYYDEAWYQIPGKLYEDGILYADHPIQPAALPSYGYEEHYPRESKIYQIMANLDLSHAEAELAKSDPDTMLVNRLFLNTMDILGNDPRGSLHNHLGMAFRRFGQEEFALRAYQNGLTAPRLSPEEKAKIIFNVSNVYKDRGNRLAQAGDYSGSVEAFTKALEYDPGNARVSYNIGVIYVNYLKRPDLGLPYLEAYLQTNPSDQNAAQLVRALKGR